MVTDVTTTATDANVEMFYVSVDPEPGQPCPTCGRKVPMTGAQRQKAYRERQRG